MANHSPPLTKRAAKACLNCRARKIRCNLEEQGSPCSNCLTDEVECITTKSRRGRKPRSGVKQKAVKSAVESATILQAALPVPNGDDPKMSTTCRGQASPTHTAEWLDDKMDLETYRELPATSTRSIAQLDTRFLHQELTYASLVDKESMRHQMNAAALTPQSLANRSQGSPVPQSLHSPRHGLPDFVKPLPSSLSLDDINYLRLKGALDIPSQNLLRALLQAHIQFVHPYMPTIDLSTIRGILNGESASISILTLQALTFASVPFVAMAEIQQAGFSSRRTCRRAFYEKTRLLYDHDVESEKIATMQAVLLMAYWNEYPGDNRGAWYWMGIAITLGQLLGMHRKAEYKIKTQESKVRKRIWWSCYIRDHMLAIAMGRPLRVKETEFDTPPLTLEDFDIIDLSDISGGELPTMDDQIALAQMCISMTELCRLSADVLELHFSILPGEKSTSTASGDNGLSATMMFLKDLPSSEQLVRSYDGELQTWYNNLPSPCVYQLNDGMNDLNPCITTNAASLHITFWSVVSALHRPQLRTKNKTLSLRRVEEAAIQVSRVDREMHQSGLDRYLPATPAIAFQITNFITHTKRLERYKTGDVPTEILESLFFCVKVLETGRESFPGGDQGGLFLVYIAKMANITVLFNQEMKFWGVEFRGVNYGSGSFQLAPGNSSFITTDPGSASLRNLPDMTHLTDMEFSENGAAGATQVDSDLPTHEPTDALDHDTLGDMLPVFDIDYDDPFAALVNLDYMRELDMVG